MPLGNPITIENESRIISVTTTTINDTFTIEGGYKINHINVYRNGVRLVSGNDFLATNGASVQLVNNPNIGDVIEFHLFDEFLVNDAIVGAASSQTIYGDLVVTGTLYTNNDLVIGSADYADVAGIETVAEGLTGSPDISVGDVNASGVVTATSFVGDGSGLSGIDATALKDSGGNIKIQANESGAVVTGILTAASGLVGPLTGNATGLSGTPDITVRNIVAAAGTFSGDLQVQGTITYEDVTNVDAIGIITAQQGINITGGYVTGNNSTNISGINSVTATTYYGDGSNLVLDYQDLTIRNWMFGAG